MTLSLLIRLWMIMQQSLFDKKTIIHYGCLRSYVDSSNKIALFNPRFPANPSSQPKKFSTKSEKTKGQIKQVGIGKSLGIIKVHLDPNGKVKSYEKFGLIHKDLEEKFKKECGYGGVEDDTHY